MSSTFRTDLKTFKSFLRDRFGFQNVRVEELDSILGGRYHIHNTTAEGVTEEFVCKINTYNPSQLPYCGIFRVTQATKHAVVMRHLLTSGIKCSEPRRSILGNDSEVYGAQNTIAEVFSYLPGMPIHVENYTAEAKYEFGVLAGHYRRTMDGFEHDAFPEQTPDEIIKDIGLANLLRLCEPVEDDANRGKLRVIVRGCLDKIEVRKMKLPIGICHGDILIQNVIRLEDTPEGGSPLQKLALIDFDFCCTSFPVFDLADTLARDALDAEIDQIPAATRPIIDGYASVCPLTKDERGTVQSALCLRFAKFLILVVNTPEDDSPLRHLIKSDFVDRIFCRLVAIWEADNDDLYQSWFGKLATLRGSTHSLRK